MRQPAVIVTVSPEWLVPTPIVKYIIALSQLLTAVSSRAFDSRLRDIYQSNFFCNSISSIFWPSSTALLLKHFLLHFGAVGLG